MPPAAQLSVEEKSLRMAVLLLKEECPRGGMPMTMRAGDPLTVHHVHRVEPGQRLDHGLRSDLVAGLLQRTSSQPSRWGWLTRAGPLTLHDEDAAWSAAWYAACAELGVRLRFVVVTRQGWRDPRTGESRQWQRLRRR